MQLPSWAITTSALEPPRKAPVLKHFRQIQPKWGTQGSAPCCVLSSTMPLWALLQASSWNEGKQTKAALLDCNTLFLVPAMTLKPELFCPLPGGRDASVGKPKYHCQRFEAHAEHAPARLL
eukprot:167072-Pelagomonas_calceolata.AAC.6